MSLDFFHNSFGRPFQVSICNYWAQTWIGLLLNYSVHVQYTAKTCTDYYLFGLIKTNWGRELLPDRNGHTLNLKFITFANMPVTYWIEPFVPSSYVYHHMELTDIEPNGMMNWIVYDRDLTKFNLQYTPLDTQPITSLVSDAFDRIIREMHKVLRIISAPWLHYVLRRSSYLTSPTWCDSIDSDRTILYSAKGLLVGLLSTTPVHLFGILCAVITQIVAALADATDGVPVPYISDEDICHFVQHAPTCLGDLKQDCEGYIIQDLQSPKTVLHDPANWLDDRMDFRPIAKYKIDQGKLKLMSVTDHMSNTFTPSSLSWNETKRKLVTAIVNRTLLFVHVSTHIFNDYMRNNMVTTVENDQVRRLLMAFSEGSVLNLQLIGPVVFSDTTPINNLTKQFFHRSYHLNLTQYAHVQAVSSMSGTVDSFKPLANKLDSSAFEFLELYRDSIRIFVEGYMDACTLENATAVLRVRVNDKFKTTLETGKALVCGFIEHVVWHHFCHLDHPQFEHFRMSAYSPYTGLKWGGTSQLRHDDMFSVLPFWLGTQQAARFRQLMNPVTTACAKNTFFTHYAPESLSSAINY